MTFSVILERQDQEQVIGTIWAPEQTTADAVAAHICPCGDQEAIVVRPSEDREVPFSPPSA